MRRSLLPQKSIATATKNMADTPDAIDTPITAGELSDEDLAAGALELGVAVIPGGVTMLGYVGSVVIGSVVAAVAVAVDSAIIAKVLLSNVLLTTTVVGLVDTPVISAETDAAVVEAKWVVSVTTDTFVAVIAPCVSGNAPDTPLQIAYPTEPSVETVSDEHDPTIHANDASPKVKPLVVFVRQRQSRSVEQQRPAAYWVVMNSWTQDKAHGGMESLR